MLRARPLVLACVLGGCNGSTSLHPMGPGTVNQYRGDPMHQGLAPTTTRLDGPPRVVWSAGPFGSGTYDASKSTPAISEDRVYVGEDDGLLRALDRGSGAVVWSFATHRHFDEAGRGDSAFTGIHGSPAFDQHNVYVGDYAGWLYAVDRKTGALVWEKAVAGSIGSSPVLDGERLYIAVEFPTPDGQVLALRASDGALLSASPLLGEHIHATVSLDQARATLVVGTNQGVLLGLSPTALTLSWTADLGGAIKSTAALADDLALVTAWDGALHVVTLSTGQPRFTVPTQDRSMSSPALWDGLVCFGSHDHSLTCADADTGQVRWQAFTGDVVSSSPVIVRASRLVVVGSCDGSLYAFALDTGALAWRLPLGTSITSVPVPVDHSLFINDDHGTVWRLDAPEM
jgi:outer membrane protein assembly factor BamB